MQHGRRTLIGIRICGLSTLMSLVALIGCAAQSGAEPGPKDGLNAGYEALSLKQYDSAISSADVFIAGHPGGPGRAEAYYLRGRALEDRPKPNSSAVRSDLQEARTAYIRALESSPSPALEGLVRAGVGNVAFFQDDYLTAQQQLTAAYEKLDKAEQKAGALYRVGRCQQRLGKFDEADRTFTEVQQKFPGTGAAVGAKQHEGARGFYVQLATFRVAADADKASGALRQQGVAPQTVRTSAGQMALRVPAGSFSEARQIKSRMAASYPDALIQP